MRKTSVYLTEEEAAALRRIAAREGRSQAELIRAALDRLVEEAERGSRRFRSLGLGHGPAYEPWRVDEVERRALGER
jgi:Arc/MetJ-type ribon-helix-helix transcriptional regulator